MADIDRAQLGAALDGLRILVKAESAAGGMGTFRAWATIAEPGAVAAAILRQVPGFGEPRGADDGRATLTIERDDLLQMIGWVNAHRPPGDWEPGFVSKFLTAAEQAVKRDE